MTRAPTYPIHRNRRNSISIRFSVRSIRFSRCGLRAIGPRPPASLALGGKEIHYPPRGAESRGSSRSTGPPQPGARARQEGPGRLPPPQKKKAPGWTGGNGKGRGRTGRRGGGSARREGGGRPCGSGGGAGKGGPPPNMKGAGLGACLHAYMHDRRGLNQLDELALADLQRRPDQG